MKSFSSIIFPAMLKSLSTGTEEDGTPRMSYALLDFGPLLLSMYSSTCLVSILEFLLMGKSYIRASHLVEALNLDSCN